jgi:hypothetical protein
MKKAGATQDPPGAAASAFKALVREAVTRNGSGKSQPRKKAKS